MCHGITRLIAPDALHTLHSFAFNHYQLCMLIAQNLTYLQADALLLWSIDAVHAHARAEQCRDSS